MSETHAPDPAAFAEQADPVTALKAVSVPLSQAAPPTEERDRMTVIVKAHHERFGRPIKSHACSFSALLETSEQTYEREYTIRAGSPMTVDFGWVDRPGLVVIESRVGKGRSRQPSAEEVAEDRLRVVDVVGTPFRVPAGGVLVSAVDKSAPLVLDCLHGSAVVQVTVIPE